MSFAKHVWLVAGASAVFAVGAAGAGLAACSSSSTPATSTDSGPTTTPDAGTPADTGTTVTDGGGSTDTGTTADTGTNTDSGPCEKPPQTFPETTPGVYCPFSAVDGGSDITCAAGQHCCETPAASNTPSTCQPIGTPCPVASSVDWECEEAIDCTAVDAGDAGGPICCGTGTPTTATHCGVTWPEFNSFTGTKCVSSCPSPGITICEVAADCKTDAGPTCTAAKANGNDFGFCGP